MIAVQASSVFCEGWTPQSSDSAAEAKPDGQTQTLNQITAGKTRRMPPRAAATNHTLTRKTRSAAEAKPDGQTQTLNQITAGKTRRIPTGANSTIDRLTRKTGFAEVFPYSTLNSWPI